MERAKGIEPSYEAWEASVLPLNYARVGAPYRDRRALTIGGAAVIREIDQEATPIFCAAVWMTRP